MQVIVSAFVQSSGGPSTTRRRNPHSCQIATPHFIKTSAKCCQCSALRSAGILAATANAAQQSTPSLTRHAKPLFSQHIKVIRRTSSKLCSIKTLTERTGPLSDQATIVSENFGLLTGYAYLLTGNAEQLTGYAKPLTNHIYALMRHAKMLRRRVAKLTRHIGLLTGNASSLTRNVLNLTPCT